MSKFAKILQESKGVTPTYFIAVADEPGVDGLQPPYSMILCDGMYEWAADWLLEILEGQKFPGGPKGNVKEEGDIIMSHFSRNKAEHYGLDTYDYVCKHCIEKPYLYVSVASRDMTNDNRNQLLYHLKKEHNIDA